MPRNRDNQKKNVHRLAEKNRDTHWFDSPPKNAVISKFIEAHERKPTFADAEELVKISSGRYNKRCKVRTFAEQYIAKNFYMENETPVIKYAKPWLNNLTDKQLQKLGPRARQ
jgi:hypothetical protein